MPAFVRQYQGMSACDGPLWVVELNQDTVVGISG